MYEKCLTFNHRIEQGKELDEEFELNIKFSGKQHNNETNSVKKLSTIDMA